jgi:7,8-dihydropterin-6-yl-methyl-4-(beta-D-ribofuranosyl)aminobenzene 5'-phosphate synthase
VYENEETQMLEVHPPHSPTHTWKDVSNPSSLRQRASRFLSRRIAIGLLLAMASYASRSVAQHASANKKIGDLKITILSTMLVSTPGGTGEWGFSALVQADGHQVLVDTGAAPDTVLKNAKALGVDLSGVRDVILTHNHDDHTSGLLTLRRELSKQNPEAMSRVYVGPGIFWSRPTKSGEDNPMIALRPAYEATGGKFVEVPEGQALFLGAWLTGPITRKYPERNWSEVDKVMTPAGLVEDTIPEDLSLVLNTTRGLVVITGCGHAGIINILSQTADKFGAQPVFAVVGGIHLYSQTDAQLDWTSDKMKSFGVENVLGAHCTGIEAVYHLRRRMGLSRKAAMVASVGSKFTLQDGIVPGELER